jgi:hypothetical protein
MLADAAGSRVLLTGLSEGLVVESRCPNLKCVPFFPLDRLVDVDDVQVFIL